MSFWEQLKQNVSQINNSLQTNISKFKNNDFAEASMAICALIASADGSINPARAPRSFVLFNGLSIGNGSNDIASVGLREYPGISAKFCRLEKRRRGDRL